MAERKDVTFAYLYKKITAEWTLEMLNLDPVEVTTGNAHAERPRRVSSANAEFEEMKQDVETYLQQFPLDSCMLYKQVCAIMITCMRLELDNSMQVIIACMFHRTSYTRWNTELCTVVR